MASTEPQPKTEGFRHPNYPTTSIVTFREFHSPDIPDAVLAAAAQLFSDHYGAWDAPGGRPGGKKGTCTISLTVPPGATR